MLLFGEPKKKKDEFNRYEIRMGNGRGCVISLYIEEPQADEIKKDPRIFDKIIKENCLDFVKSIEEGQLYDKEVMDKIINESLIIKE